MNKTDDINNTFYPFSTSLWVLYDGSDLDVSVILPSTTAVEVSPAQQAGFP